MVMKMKDMKCLIFVLSVLLIVSMITYILFNLINKCIGCYNKSSTSTSLGYSLIEGMENAALEAQIEVLKSQIILAESTKKTAEDQYNIALTERDNANSSLSTAQSRASTASAALEQRKIELDEVNNTLSNKKANLELLEEQLGQ